MTAHFDGIILAGGSSKRFGGADKALLQLGSQSFLERSLGALSGAGDVVVVGPPRAGFDDVRWGEDPSGGPVPALAAGLSATSSDVVVLLAVDMPLVTDSIVHSLVEHLESTGADGAALSARPGDLNHLAGAYRRRPLSEALEGSPELVGMRLRDLMDQLRIEAVDSDAARDCDTPEELERLRAELP